MEEILDSLIYLYVGADGKLYHSLHKSVSVSGLEMIYLPWGISSIGFAFNVDARQN